MNWADLDAYQYTLPPELIRRVPLEPRDSARLFVYDTATDTVTFDTFRNLAQYLPTQALIVLNNTQVKPARLWLKKPTGGKVEVLILLNEWEEGELIPGVVDRRVNRGDALRFPDGSQLLVREQQAGRFSFELVSQSSLELLLQRYGTTPVPHYLEGETALDETWLRQRYQTVFAALGASIAAPTASLHFTKAVFQSLEAKDISRTTLTLNVGLGTFAPLTERNFITKTLHAEWVALSEAAAQAINTAKANHRPVVAVGTTVTRSLEALAQAGRLSPGEQLVDLFLQPGDTFQIVDALITNFHLPKTSLMLLVEAFLRQKQARRTLLTLYQQAIEAKFAFYSFGDSLLIR